MSDVPELDAANATLLESIPTWKDKAVRKRESNALAKFMTGQGYTEDEARRCRDPRVIASNYANWQSTQRPTVAVAAERAEASARAKYGERPGAEKRVNELMNQLRGR